MTKRKTKDALKAIFDFSNKMSKEQAKIRNKSKEIRHNYIMRIETSEKWMSEKWMPRNDSKNTI